MWIAVIVMVVVIACVANLSDVVKLPDLSSTEREANPINDNVFQSSQLNLKPRRLPGSAGRCRHHPSQDAVSQCRGCGAFICSDCTEMYGVTSGDYAGQSLCYDCTVQLISTNASIVELMKKKFMIEGIAVGVLSVIGLVLGLQFGDVWWWILMGLGGNLWLIIKDATLGGLSAMGGVWFIASIFTGPIIPIVRIVSKYTKMQQCEQIVAGERETLRQMADYFAYTQAMEKTDDDKGFDALTAEGGELFSNTYAQSVKTKGEKEAQTQLRNSVVQISANGEIIRSFEPLKAA